MAIVSKVLPMLTLFNFLIIYYYESIDYYLGQLFEISDQ